MMVPLPAPSPAKQIDLPSHCEQTRRAFVRKSITVWLLLLLLIAHTYILLDNLMDCANRRHLHYGLMWKSQLFPFRHNPNCAFTHSIWQLCAKQTIYYCKLVELQTHNLLLNSPTLCLIADSRRTPVIMVTTTTTSASDDFIIGRQTYEKAMRRRR